MSKERQRGIPYLGLTAVAILLLSSVMTKMLSNSGKAESEQTDPSMVQCDTLSCKDSVKSETDIYDFVNDVMNE